MGTTRDYYADLDLPATADEIEIKKQYRKLALKYHPDRNRGREQEANARFLIIQTAHDILTDPQQKAKYDEQRRTGGGRYPMASGVRGNPWSDIGQQYPMPPRRRNEQTPKSSNTSRGADRWNTRFATGVPPTSKNYTSDAEAKKNFASAFEHMRSKPPTGAKSNQGASRTSGPPPPTPPRTESAKQRAQASFGASTSRRGGYQPRGTGAGDEPQVPNRNYASRPDNQRPVPDPTGSQSQTTQAPMPDPLRQFREASQADNRHRTPYTTGGGEKTNPFDGVNLGRSKSTREVPRKEVPTSPSKEAKSETHSNGGSSTLPRETPAGKPTIFNISDDEAPPLNKSTKSSVDDINTSFVQDDGKTAWQFNAGSQQHASPTKASQNGGEPPLGSEASKTSTGDEPSQDHGTFDANNWGDQFGPHTFEPQTRSVSSASPSKASRANSKKTRTPKSPQRSKDAIDGSSDDEDGFSWQGRKGGANPLTTDSPQAMDIDPPAEPPTKAAQENEVRNIPVEPSRPEWRSGSLNTASGIAKGSGEEQPKHPNVAGSEDSEEFKASFADLKNVAPFAQQSSGLRSFSEMKDQLPFQSKASDDVTFETEEAVAPLEFPAPPTGPRPPPTVAVEGIKPNVASWEKYAAQFEDYLRLWDLFNGQVTDHFAERKSRLVSSRKNHGYAFLRARGDGECTEYLKSIKQDNMVRARWNAACAEHEQRLEEFMAFREKMK